VQLSTTDIKLSVDVIRLSLYSSIQEHSGTAAVFQELSCKKNKGGGEVDVIFCDFELIVKVNTDRW
jgi:hypothetical protein